MRAALFLGLSFLFPFLFGSLLVAGEGRERVGDSLKRAVPSVAETENGEPQPDAVEETPAGTSFAERQEMDVQEDTDRTPVLDLGPREAVKTVDGVARVIVLPVNDAISKPNEFILRRGIKEAIAADVGVVVLEIDTPGGRVDVMLEIMELLGRFEGRTIAYVNDEAISAGALIASVADEIWYAPRAVIGSAGVVSGGGEEIPETMRQKVESYLYAKLRSFGGPHPYREQVVRAMMDADYELEIDGKVISPAGDMLNLTAAEALEHYGNPPRALFGDGMADDVSALLDERFGAGQWEKQTFEVTWSEELAVYLSSIAPLLIAFGVVGLFIEFKTPGFGIFGILGIACLAIVFLTNYVAGLAGWEPFLIMLLGLALIALELFILPGAIVFISLGGILVIGALLWSMTDIWPGFEGEGIEVQWHTLMEAATQLSLGIILGTILVAVLWRLMPRTHFLDRLILGGAAGLQGIPDAEQVLQTPPGGSSTWPDLGAVGVVTRSLRPAGEVEIDGRRYEARVGHGMVARGESVRVVRRAQFGLEVEPWEEGVS